MEHSQNHGVAYPLGTDKSVPYEAVRKPFEAVVLVLVTYVNSCDVYLCAYVCTGDCCVLDRHG